MYKVFISHGWHDRWIARQMHNLLKQHDVAAFIDIYDIKKGDRITERIEHGISSSEELICLITPWSVDRNWVWVEMGMMRALKRRVTAVLYGIDMKEVNEKHGGLTFLSESNIADINDFSTYIEEVAQRARDSANA